MREIIQISTGQCGNQIGTAFWEAIAEEHGIDHSGKHTGSNDISNEKLDVYFREAGRKYIPRAVLVDLEPGTMDAVRSGSMGNFFRPDNFVHAASSAGNNWAKGYYTEGNEIIEEVMDVIRREVEAAELPQGFQLTHSLGGGTGSGLGSLILSKLHDEYPGHILASFSVAPTGGESDTVVEPYNAVLAFNQLLEHTHETFCLDNQALYNIYQNTLRVAHPTYSDLNKLVANVMSGITTSVRYPGQLNSDLRKLAVNLVPFNRMHFFTVAYAPLMAANARNFRSLSVAEITQQLFDSGNTMAGADPRLGKYLTCAAFYRGDASMREIEDQMWHHRKRSESLFVPWLDNVQASVCNVPLKGLPLSATFVANSTSISQLISRVHNQFETMFKRKAFMHWYTEEGMEEGEFQEADNNIVDLLSEYGDQETAVVYDPEAMGVDEDYVAISNPEMDLSPMDAEMEMMMERA